MRQYFKVAAIILSVSLTAIAQNEPAQMSDLNGARLRFDKEIVLTLQTSEEFEIKEEEPWSRKYVELVYAKVIRKEKALCGIKYTKKMPADDREDREEIKQAIKLRKTTILRKETTWQVEKAVQRSELTDGMDLIIDGVRLNVICLAPQEIRQNQSARAKSVLDTVDFGVRAFIPRETKTQPTSQEEQAPAQTIVLPAKTVN